MPSRFATLIPCLLVVLAQPATAQQVAPVPATRPVQFESWQAAALDPGSMPAADRSITSTGEKKDTWLIGGAVGAAAGIVFCTAVSTLMNDSASRGLSFCPHDAYLIMGGAGFVLGAAIAAVF